MKVLKPTDLTLTCKGLGSVNWGRGEDDFEFVSGDDKVCHVRSTLVEFLSPQVARIRKNDPLCYEYTFKNSGLFDIFESVVSRLQSGQPLRVEKSNFPELLRLSHELDNSELLSSLLELIKPESLTLEEVIVLLKAAMDVGTAFSAQFDRFRNFLASHFYDIQKEILDNLDLETTQVLLSSPSLKILDEDSLYEFVRSRSEKDERFSSLFEFVYFEYVSDEHIDGFVSFVSEKLLGNISAGIWARIGSRLKVKNAKNERNPRVFIPPEREITYDQSKPFNGIIAHLTRECGGNVHERGIVRVMASSVGPSSHLKSVVDLGTGEDFQSQNFENSWVEYDFVNRRVCPTSYSIKTANIATGGSHPKNWVLEASNDRESWTVLNEVRYGSGLDRRDATFNFLIDSRPQKTFRYVRIRLTGKNCENKNTLVINSLEVFGVLSSQH